jgi:hypothetical protein
MDDFDHAVKDFVDAAAHTTEAGFKDLVIICIYIY